LIALEQLSRELPKPILGHPQLQRAHPRDQRTSIIAAAVGQTRCCPFPLRGPDRLRHLGFQRRLQQRFQPRSDKVLVLPKQRFDIDLFRLTLALGHGVLPSYGGDCNITCIP
jgi:hypothetical protein